MPIFVFKARKPQQPQGQGIFSYGAANVLVTEDFTHQNAPEPAYPQGNLPARPARRQVAVMALFGHSNSGILGEFIPYGHELLAIHAPHNDGTKRLVGHSGVNSERTNIRKPSAIAYGSLYELIGQ